jgi:hypothetical protein
MKNENKIETEFNLVASETFRNVTWADVSAEDLTWALEVCSTEAEVVNELIGLFSHPTNL